MKPKIYVITLSKVFPKTHKRKGEATFFEEKFRKQKLHTIRANYDLWKKRFEEIEKGKAVLSVRQWTGTPYRSKQREIACLTDIDGIGIQKLRSFDKDTAYFVGNNGNVLPVPLQELANNDGLSLNEWKGWFENNAKLPLAIIHFTKFRY